MGPGSAPRRAGAHRGLSGTTMGKHPIHISNSAGLVDQQWRHEIAFSRRISPEVSHQVVPRKSCRGRRECRVKASPMARLRKKMQAAGTTGAAVTGIPCAMVFTLIRSLPGAPACWPPCRDNALARIAQVTPASGCQDAATSRPREIVRRRPREKTLRSLAAIASPPRVS
jgi:hypothetical protein